MTISTTENRYQYTGDGTTTAFSFPRYFESSSHLKVYADSTLQTISTHYTVTGAGSGGGGTVTFVTAPASGVKVTIIREEPYTQTVATSSIRSNQAEVIEAALDRGARADQRIADELGRALRFAPYTAATGTTVPDPSAEKFLRWNVGGTALENYAIGSSTLQIPADASVTTAKINDGAVTDAKIASPSLLKNRITDQNDARDWDTSTAFSSSSVVAKIQAAADAFADGTNLAPLYVPSVRAIIGDTLMLPSSFVLRGAGRHDDLREFGDTTGGVAHPLRGTIFTTDFAAITARRWTDINGSDTNIKPAIVLLGQNILLENFTLYTTPALATACHTGIHIAGTGRHRIYNVDVRGGWQNGAIYMDGTWGTSNTTLNALSHLPSWFDSDYATLYDYGLTDNKIRDSRFYGIRAVTVQGSTRSSGTWVWGPNGISDTVFSDCAFYNEGDQTTRLASGALIYVDYQVDAGVNAQGLAFHSCRYDVGSKWVAYLNRIDDVSFEGGRTFCETSGAWYAATTSRGIFETTSNTGDVYLDGEFYANIKPAGGSEVDIRTLRYNNTGGEKITYRDRRSSTRGSVSSPSFRAYGADSGQDTEVMSWSGTTKIISRASGVVETALSISPTSTLIESLKTDTTASAANVNVNAANGNIRQVTSLAAHKDVLSEVTTGTDIISRLRPLLYRSLLPADDPGRVFPGFVVEDFLEAGLAEYVLHDSEGRPTGLAYDRLTVPLASAVKQLDARLTALEAAIAAL